MLPADAHSQTHEPTVMHVAHGERSKVFPVFLGSEHVTDQWVLNSPLLLLPLYTAYSCQYCTWKKHCFSLIIYTLLILVTKTALKQVLIHYGVTETNEGDLGDSFPVDWFLFKSYKGPDTPNLTARNGICYQLTAATDTHWMPKCWCSWLHPNTYGSVLLSSHQTYHTICQIISLL